MREIIVFSCGSKECAFFESSGCEIIRDRYFHITFPEQATMVEEDDTLCIHLYGKIFHARGSFLNGFFFIYQGDT